MIYKENPEGGHSFWAYISINGQSIEVIKSYSSDEDFPVCSRTLRNYIDKGLLTAKNIDLRRKKSIRLSKNYNYPRTYSHNPLRKIDHLYDDYIHYMLQTRICYYNSK